MGSRGSLSRLKTPCLGNSAEVWKVGNYFDVEGYFDEWGMGEAAERLVLRLEKKVENREDKKSKKKDK